MLQLSKKVEYGLIALRHMAMSPVGQVFTAKEIAMKYNIPYEFLAKVLQKLTKAGVVTSFQGMRGGYLLAQEAQRSSSFPRYQHHRGRETDNCRLLY